MNDEALTFELRDNVAWLTLNRPAVYNAMNGAMTMALCEAANRCSGDPSVRAVVISGAGDQAFCAGGDVGSFLENKDRVGTLVREMTMHLHAAVSRFAWMRAPVIASVNGIAAGAGLSIVGFADLVIAADTASFTSAYTRIGFTPDGSSSFFLSRILGQRRAMELYLTNRVLSAQEALEWGLVNRVVPQADLRVETEALATQLAQGPTVAFGGVKKLLQMAGNDSLEGQMERETRLIAETAESADGREGVAAFVEKRKPVFRGR